MKRDLVGADHVRRVAKAARELRLVKGRSLLTDEARDLAHRLGLKMIWIDPKAPPASAGPAPSSGFASDTTPRAQVALGADHGGWPLKERLRLLLEREGWTVLDLGCHGSEAVDYPDYARAVAEAVANGRAARGVMVDSVGVASAMVANRVPGVRAAACESLATALSSRRHNDANLLTLGGKLLDGELACRMVQAWLDEPYEGGRHQARVDKMMALDRGGR